MLKIYSGMAGTHPVTQPILGRRRATCIAKSRSKIQRCRASLGIHVPRQRAEILEVVHRQFSRNGCRDCVNGLETGKPSVAIHTKRLSELTAWSTPNAPTA